MRWVSASGKTPNPSGAWLQLGVTWVTDANGIWTGQELRREAGKIPKSCLVRQSPGTLAFSQVSVLLSPVFSTCLSERFSRVLEGKRGSPKPSTGDRGSEPWRASERRRASRTEIMSAVCGLGAPLRPPLEKWVPGPTWLSPEFCCYLKRQKHRLSSDWLSPLAGRGASLTPSSPQTAPRKHVVGLCENTGRVGFEAWGVHLCLFTARCPLSPGCKYMGPVRLQLSVP